MKKMIKELKMVFADSIMSGKTKKQKAILIWFGVSFGLLACLGGPLWLTVVLSINFIASAVKVVKNVPLKDI